MQKREKRRACADGAHLQIRGKSRIWTLLRLVGGPTQPRSGVWATRPQVAPPPVSRRRFGGCAAGRLGEMLLHPMAINGNQPRPRYFWPAVFLGAFFLGAVLWGVWMYKIVERTRSEQNDGFFVPRD